MPWIVYFIAGGGTFLPGAGLLAVAVISRAFLASRWVGVISIAMAVIAVALVTISAEAISWWIYWIWTGATLAWFLRGSFKSRRLKGMIDLGELAITFAAAALAFSFHFRPALPREAYPRMYVIGDSISAGIGAKHRSTWPGILAGEHRVQVIDLARRRCNRRRREPAVEI